MGTSRLGMFLQCSGNSNKSKIFPMLVGCALMGALSACDRPKSDDALWDQIHAQDLRIDQLRDSIRTSKSTADLTPADKGYSWLDTEVGKMAFSIEKVTASGNGSRVKLRVGNTANVSLEGVKLMMLYGENDAAGDAVGKQHEFEATLDTPVYAGAWSSVTLDLPDVPPAKLGYIKVYRAGINRIVLNPAYLK